MPLCISAQSVSATFFNIPQQKVYLNAYTGLYMEVLDSVMMSNDKRVEFNTTMKTGMYQLETEFGETLDFIYDDAPVKIVVKDIDDINSIGFVDSQININWYAYLIMKERTLNSLNILKPVLREYDKESDFYIKAKNEYQSLQDNFVSYTDSIMLDNNYASQLIKVDRFTPLNLDYDFKKQRDDLVANFFNDVDFNNLSLIPTNVLTTKIIDFLSILQTSEQNYEQQILSFILGIDKVLYLASTNFEMYKFVFQYLIEVFQELSINEVVDYMTRIPYSEKLDCSEEEYNELLSIVEFNSRVKIGNLAKNISGKTIFDEEFDMYDIDSKFTIVYFWSYTCEHCRENIKDLKIFLDENTDFSLVAVSVKGDIKKIKKLIKKVKIKGYFYHDGLEWKTPFVDDYAVTSTPSFYILDKDKKILFKPFDFNELNNFVNLIIKQ